jgi:hypothetical protein
MLFLAVEQTYLHGWKAEMSRFYIYIHGAPDEATMGVPGSKGCIRLRNQDIIELFERVKIGENVVVNIVLIWSWLHYNNIFTDFNAFKQLNNILVTQSNTTF